jgi:hypothetical protein
MKVVCESGIVPNLNIWVRSRGERPFARTGVTRDLFSSICCELPFMGIELET